MDVTSAAAGTLRAGVHLPQAGPAASGESLRRTALLAEQLGYADVWVSDHLAIPADAEYPPSAYLYEALVSLAWVASCTQRIGLGTSVLVLPMRNPVALAKMLASLDQMSGGRVILGAASGWLEAEFDAIGVPFRERGKRTDEAITMLRSLWTEDPITAEYPVHGARMRAIRAKPQPQQPIPIWIGGHSQAALERAARCGDGWHGAFLDAQRCAALVGRLREQQLPDHFVFSLRLNRDPLHDDTDAILAEYESLRDIGITHVVIEPRQREADQYLRSVERSAELLRKAGADMAA